MKILIDAMGGDHAPGEIIRGALLAARDFPAHEIGLIGQTEKIRAEAAERGLDLNAAPLRLHHAADVIGMCDPPLSVRSRKNSSLRLGCEMTAAGEYDGFLSAGSTGALYTAASLFIGRIPGVRRSAIAAILPFPTPVLLLDAGANTNLTPDQLASFALLGDAYMRGVFGLERPRVGLLNNGTEEYKGGELQQKCFSLLKNEKSICFVGNVEAKEVPFNMCDLLITDGFSGNILLKTMEGMGKFMAGEIKTMLTGSVLRRTAAPLYRKSAVAIKKNMDASEYGGAPLLGIRRPVIKAHGSSDALAIRNAVKQTITYGESGMIDRLTAEFSKSNEKETETETGNISSFS